MHMEPEARTPKGRTRTMPGKYSVGSWQSVTAADAQKILEEEIIATQRLTVVRCLYGKGSSFERHMHAQEQITIVETGTLEFLVDGEAIVVGPGQMISIFAGVLHASRVVSEESARALNIFYAADNASSAARAARPATASES